jgi:hypothetical protein
MKQQLLAGAAVLFIATPVFGHHSNSALDMSSVTTIEGTVIEYSLRNPHSYFVVETTNQAGETVSWDVQMGSANSVMRRGWTRDTLETGDRVVVGVHAARDGRPRRRRSSRRA